MSSRGHRGPGHAARDRLKEIVVGGHPLPRRHESELTGVKISRPRIEKVGRLAIAPAFDAVARCALLGEGLLASRERLGRGGRGSRSRARRDQQGRCKGDGCEIAMSRPHAFLFSKKGASSSDDCRQRLVSPPMVECSVSSHFWVESYSQRSHRLNVALEAAHARFLAQGLRLA